MDRQSDKITALYCRIDGPVDTVSDTVAKSQMDALSRYAEQHNLGNQKFYCDWGFSGTTSNRPGYQDMLREVRAGMVSALVVVDISRLTRNSIDVWELLGNVFPQYGVALHTIADGGKIIDTLPQMQKAIIELYRLDVEGGQE